MATKNNSVEIVETTEAQAPEVATKVEAEVVAETGLFTKIGKKFDGGIAKIKDFGKRNGKKIAKGAGVAAGAAVAVVGTAIVMDTMEKAKALSEGTDDDVRIIIEPIGETSSDEADYTEASEEATA